MRLESDPHLILDVAVRRGLLSEAQANDCRGELGRAPDPVGWLVERKLLAPDEALLLRELLDQIRRDRRVTQELVRDGFLSRDTAELLLEHEIGSLTTERLPDLRTSAKMLGVDIGGELDRRAVPSRIGRYEILRELGRGGMGLVYAARDTELGREVALKVIRGSLDTADVDRFRREARLMAGLHHPRIVSVFDVGEDEASPYFVMNLVPGASLASRALPRRDAVLLLKSISDAIQYAHESGILHRDIKPENILVDDDGRGYITDFGLARPLQGPGTLSGAVVGTPGYMSPEQARGEVSKLDARTDVWGLGATLYFILTGQPPFVGATAFETVSKVLEEEPRRPRRVDPTIAPDLEAICLKALEKKREHRYESAREFGADLGRYIHGESVQAQPIAPGRWFFRKLLRHRRALVLSAALLVGVAVASAWGIASWMKSRAFERSRARAMEAFHVRDWERALALGEETLGHRDDPTIRALVGECRKNLLFEESHGRVRARCQMAEARFRHLEDSFYMPSADLQTELRGVQSELDDLEVFLGDSDFAEGWRTLGFGRYLLSDYPGAERALLRAQSLDASDGIVRYYLARTALEYAANEFLLCRPLDPSISPMAVEVSDQAARWLQGAAPGFGKDPALERQIADAYAAWTRGDSRQGRRICQSGLEQFGSRVRTEDLRLLLSLTEPNCRARAEQCELALRIRPHFPLAYVFRGNARECFDRRGAIADYTSALSLSPRFAKVFTMRGSVKADVGDRTGALADFAEAIRLDPSETTAYAARAALRSKMGDRPGAEADYAEAIRLRPDRSVPLYNRGVYRYDEGDVEGAVRDYSEAIRKSPRFWPAYHNRGVAYASRGEIVRALADLEAAMLLSPRTAKIHLERGHIWYRLRQFERAVAECTRSIDWNPTYLKTFFNRGLARLSTGSYHPAIQDFTRVTLLDPSGADAYAYRGWARLQIGDNIGGLGDLIQASGLAPAKWKLRANVTQMIGTARRRLLRR